MITKIVDRLKTGRITNVVAYGQEQGLNPPYVVVKPEVDPLGNGRIFRVITHMLPGQQIFLEDYTFNELFDLLNKFYITDRHGNHNILLTRNEFTDIIIGNDDKTISMERVFFAPYVII